MAIAVANGKPTKSFFVRMITRDIALQDCILDLIDNSIDGAWDQEGSRPASLDQKTDLSKYLIEIDFDAGSFSIRDNCGGISLYDAEKYAFTFGRDDSDDKAVEEQHEDFSIGVYGIGMKRAAFKIGRKINVRSTYLEKKKVDAFHVPIDVRKWIKDEVWDFSIDSDDPLKAPGVEVRIKDLNDDVSAAFSTKAFETILKKIIARDYALHFHYGIKIRVNKKDVVGWQISFLQGEDFEPLRQSLALPAFKEVKVELFCGMSAPPPDDIDPDETIDEEDRFGWYVACNGRFVLSADKTAMSGWGTENWPSWHGQYNGFLGLLFLSAEDTNLLPVTTTKRNIDPMSPVFRAIQPHMREVTKEWIKYTNARKTQLERAKQSEERAKPIPLAQISARSILKLPDIQVVRKPKERVANILYAVPLAQALAMGEAFGNRLMPYKHIGKKTFEYCYKQLVGKS